MCVQCRLISNCVFSTLCPEQSLFRNKFCIMQRLNKHVTKNMVTLCKSAGLPGPLLSAYGIRIFFKDKETGTKCDLTTADVTSTKNYVVCLQKQRPHKRTTIGYIHALGYKVCLPSEYLTSSHHLETSVDISTT